MGGKLTEEWRGGISQLGFRTVAQNTYRSAVAALERLVGRLGPPTGAAAPAPNIACPKSFNLDLSGNEVDYTAYSLLVIVKHSRSKLQCQIVLN